MSQDFALSAKTNDIPILGLLNKGLDAAIDVGSQIGVAAYNSHNAKKAAERQIEATKELMALQYQYNKWAYQYQQTKGPSLYRQGLTDAGYNPILPFTGGSGLTNASFGATGQGSAALENPALVDGNSINSARLVSLQQRQIKSQIQNTNANTELQQEQAQSERVDQVLKSNQSEIARLDTQLKQKDLDVWDKRWALEQKERLTSINTMLRNARSQEAIAGASVVNARTNEYQSRTERYNSITNRYRLKGAGFEINDRPFYFNPSAEKDYYMSIY